MKTSNESGRSMVEMLGVIAIIGVISVGAITSMSYVDSYFRTSATLMELEQIARDINDMYSWSSDYSGLNATQLCNEKIVQNCTGTSSSKKIQNRWGGELTVSTINSASDFKITLTKVPKIPCERLKDQAPDMLMSLKITSPSTCSTSNSVIFSSQDVDVTFKREKD